MTLSAPLPTMPVSGDKFILFAGGKQASTKEVLCMLAGGKQPEIEIVTGTNVTGVTLKKISPLLGVGTLQLYYTNSSNIKTLKIRMGTSGDYGPEVQITHDVQNLVLFTPDLLGYIVVDVVFASLSTSSSRSDNLTLTMPKGNMLPNLEGYETNDGVGRTRYHLFPLKNKATDPEDVVSGMMFWTGRPPGTNTTPTSSYSVSPTASQTINVTNASDWPTRGFWVKNISVNNGQGDLRYVDYRSGNSLYTKPVQWGWVDFKDGLKEIKPGMTIVSSASTNYTAVVDQVRLTGGSWTNGDATGRLILKKWLTNFSFSTSYGIMVGGERYATPSATSVRGFRDCQAQQWTTAHVVVPASDIDLGLELPGENGFFSDPVTENIQPAGVDFGCYDDAVRSAFIGPIMAGESVGIWLRQTILDGTQARQDIDGSLCTQWY
ncbi:MAG TPA: hypothetical protein DEB39_10745 [Planctomycetaceae bacterium]|nr:hypothetical protein [Planctomycetaceae bacterium]